MKKRLLIVEDDADIQLLLTDLVGFMGYETRTVSDGEEALKEVEIFKPDAMILDMSLPKISGWEVARTIRRMPGLQTLPILALTAHAMADDPQKAASVGCNAYLAKPFDHDILMKHIEGLLKIKR